jgi:hypothetical protein
LPTSKKKKEKKLKKRGKKFVMKKVMPLRDQTRDLRESIERSVSCEIQGFLACDLRHVLGFFSPSKKKTEKNGSEGRQWSVR